MSNRYNESIDYFNTPSPIACNKLNIVSYYFMIIFVLSIVFNSLLILIFVRYEKYKTPLNLLILALVIINWIGTVIEFPVVIATNFVCK